MVKNEEYGHYDEWLDEVDWKMFHVPEGVNMKEEIDKASAQHWDDMPWSTFLDDKAIANAFKAGAKMVLETIKKYL